jgi:RHH-type rel operon transcriptional repressor/antitoxin RelB
MADVLISVRFSDEESDKLKKISALTKRSRSFFIRQAVREKLEDQESYYLGEAALHEWIAEGKKEYSLGDLEAMIENGFPEPTAGTGPGALPGDV